MSLTTHDGIFPSFFLAELLYEGGGVAHLVQGRVLLPL